MLLGPAAPSSAAPAEPVPAATNWTAIRLPAWIAPSHYSVDLATRLSDSTFGGKVTIDLQISKQSNFIVVHQAGLTIGAVELADVSGKSIPIRSIEHRPAEQYIVVFVSQPLAPGAFQISLEFKGTLTESLDGYRLSRWTDDSGNSRYITATQLEPTLARTVFPCLDEPAMKSIFTFKLSAETPFHVISNMPLNSTLDLGHGMRKFIFDPTPKMSSYLIAFAVSDFEYVEKSTNDGVVLRVYTQPGRKKLGEYALETGVKVLEYYGKIFDSPYPLPKMDFFPVSTQNGAMENWGLITYEDGTLLYDEKTGTNSNRQMVASAVSHELAHQWFGNLVTTRWWNDAWLNEGFASYAQGIGADGVEPELQLLAQYDTDYRATAFGQDQSILSHSIVSDVKTPGEIGGSFDGIIYQKGGLVLNMAEAWLDSKMGKGYFRSGIQKYLKAHQFGNAETFQLWDALQDPKLGNLHAFMSTWTDQPGFPLISITSPQKSLEDDTSAAPYFTASQSRFLFARLIDPLEHVDTKLIPDTMKTPNVTQQLWHVPMTVKLLSNATGKVKQVGDAIDVELTERGPVRIKLPKKLPEHTIVVGNVGQVGVYRVLHDERSLRYLIDWLSHDLDVISNVDRAGLFTDVVALTLSGHIKDATIMFDLAKVFKHETDPIVWLTILPSWNTVKQSFAGQSSFAWIEQFERNLLSKIVEHLGWKETTKAKKQHHLKSICRGAVFVEAVRVGHEKTVKQALKLFKQLRQGKSINKLDVSVDVFRAIVVAGVQYGDQDDFEWVVKQYRDSTFAPDQRVFLEGIVASRDAALQRRALELALGNEIRLQHTLSLVQLVATSSPQGHVTAWLFLMDKWTQYAGRDGIEGPAAVGGSLGGVVGNIVARFTSPYLISEAKRVFVDRKDSKLVPPESSFVPVVRGLETCRQLLAWRQTAESHVVSWLKAELGDDVAAIHGYDHVSHDE
eukprot:jgi/Hompol1/1790/HPOL_004804-RA